MATQLQVVTVNITVPEECFNAKDIEGGMSENVIGTGVFNGGRETCYGVSGGPLDVRGQLVGTLS